jgi:hypothetical protein
VVSGHVRDQVKRYDVPAVVERIRREPEAGLPGF